METQLDQQTRRYRAAVAALNDAIERQQAAKAKADQTKDDLEDAKTDYMRSPLFVRLRHRAPAEEREANIRAALAEEVEANRQARAELWQANAELARARANEQAEQAIFYAVLFQQAPEWYKSKQDPIRNGRERLVAPTDECALDDSA